jgi:hypothetical protein
MSGWCGALAVGLLVAAAVGCAQPPPTATVSATATAAPAARPTASAAAPLASPTPPTVVPAAGTPTVGPRPSGLVASGATIKPVGTAIVQEKSRMAGTPNPTPDPALRSFVEPARADLVRRLGVGADSIELIEARSVVWPDRSLGCPQPGVEYPQVQQEGLLIRFRVGGRVYQYHGGGGRAPFLCERPAIAP